jgi:hypothetical protein
MDHKREALNAVVKIPQQIQSVKFSTWQHPMQSPMAEIGQLLPFKPSPLAPSFYPIFSMSDVYLRYVPVDPEFVPQEQSIRAATSLLCSFVNVGSVECRISQEVEFVDAGENWEGVYCPSCGADAETWWPTAMDTAAESHFSVLDVHAQCCGIKVALNELRYIWPVAFGRCVLQIANPGIPGLQPGQLAQVEDVLGCRLREIQAHI